MEVRLLPPFGYCEGVVMALKKAEDAKLAYPDRDVYLLGAPVHNELVVSSLLEKGLLLLDEKKAPLLRQLSALKEGDVVVLSAHGHPLSYEEIAKDKGLILIDATCPMVKATERIGMEEKAPFVYVGVKGHAESEAFLSNCPHSGFYDVSSQKLLKESEGQAEIALTQTTLSHDEIEEAKEALRPLYPNLCFLKERCHATTLRQKALEEMDPSIEAVIILGSKSSNNTLKLYEIASKRRPTFLCLDEKEARGLDLSRFHVIGLTSGASTPASLVLSVKDALEKDPA